MSIIRATVCHDESDKACPGITALGVCPNKVPYRDTSLLPFLYHIPVHAPVDCSYISPSIPRIVTSEVTNMTGRGKGAKGLGAGKGAGKGGAKRHRKILRDNIQGKRVV